MPITVRGKGGEVWAGRLERGRRSTRLDAASLVANAATAAVAIDLAGSIREWNDKAAKLLGYPSGEALGRRFDDLLKPRDVFGNPNPVRGIPFLQSTLEGEAIYPFDAELRAAENSSARVQVSVVVVLGPSTPENRLVLLLRPQHNRRRADEVIERILSSPRFRRRAGLRLVSEKERERLSDRELEVLELLAAGDPTRRIAERLEVSVHTVRNHTRSILRKLESHSRAEAVANAYKLGII